MRRNPCIRVLGFMWVLEALYQYRRCWRSFCHPEVSALFNLPGAPSPARLAELIDKLESRGLVRLEFEGGGQCAPSAVPPMHPFAGAVISMTAAGGAYWEDWMQPWWSCYVHHNYDGEEPRIECTSLDVLADALWFAGAEPQTPQVLEEWAPFYWREPFPRAYSAVIPSDDCLMGRNGWRNFRSFVESWRRVNL